MADSGRELLRLVVAGHVDHGKSTLIGRLLFDTASLPAAKMAEIETLCARRGMPFEWSFVLDALQIERDQGITLDTTQMWLRGQRRDIVIIDAPGHKEFLKNMVTGAASADAAVLVIDAEQGVSEQTRRHAYLLHLLGIRQVVVAVNKMDLAGYDEARFAAVAAEIRRYLGQIGLTPSHVIPLMARSGENVAKSAPAMGWYPGPDLLGALDRLTPAPGADELPLRLPIQDVYKFDARRILAGRIESGRLSVGDRLLFSPVNKSARIATIEAWPAPATPILHAHAGCSVAITLDEPLFVERGHIASHVEAPPVETDVFRARLFWLGRRPLALGQKLKLKLATEESEVSVQSIERVIDTTSLTPRAATLVARNEVAEVVLRSRDMLALDAADLCPRTGRFVLVDDFTLAGGGIVSMRDYADQRELITRRATNLKRVEHGVSLAQRMDRNGHKGGVLWLTGLSGAGKSTLAIAVETELFARGYQAYVLDGDNLRFGLNANLGFSPEDRAENIRRVGEVAALFARAGFIVLTAFISPYRSDRDRARQAAGSRNGGEGGSFHEIYVKASLEACETRDPKGLYAKARTGEIRNFTGVSAPYEPPEQADLVVETDRESVESSVRHIVDYVTGCFRLAPSR